MSQNRLIKKYANRRLYDTVASKHVTLRDIRKLVVEGFEIQIIEDTTGDDITRSLLLQIIAEQEGNGGQPILTEVLLSQLIRFYGNPMQGMMSEYLQKSVSTFVQQQSSIQDQMQHMMSHTPAETITDLMQQNLKTWDTLFRGATGNNNTDKNS